MTAALFLDRDGVINRKAPEGSYVTAWDDFRFEPGVLQALATVHVERPEVPVIVVTNQRAVALGIAGRQAVDDLHERMLEAVRAAGGRIDAVQVCPHDIGVCDCRKPALGLFREAMRAFPTIEPETSVVVGDSFIDMQAGHDLGARVALVGEDASRQVALDAAGSRGIRVDTQAASLADLVEAGPLLAWLGPAARSSGARPRLASPTVEGSLR